MKLGIKIGDKAKVIKGKFAGKEADVLFIDKKNLRVRLNGLKKLSLKTKKGDKEVHGTFHLSSLQIQKPVAATETAPAAGNAQPAA